MNGEMRVVNDVAAAYAALIEEAFLAGAKARGSRPFRLAASGGNSGAASFRGLMKSEIVDFSEVDLYFVDERCVDPTSDDSNQHEIAEILGDKRATLAGFHPMSCEAGAEAYDQLLREAGELDAVQLGLGPDGHTASIFPGSAALEVNDSRLVVKNVDPSGRNEHDRLTLTYAGIRLAPLVVFCVIGAARADVVAKIAAGEDLPASRVVADRVVWLIETAAGSLLTGPLSSGVRHE
jgi:6-phosphogluconolactonase/glucosamine-6-phosphate isomerase/deaminase